MKKSKFLFSILIICTLAACTVENDKTKVEVDAYFNLGALLNEKIEYLASANAKLQKELTSQGASELLTIDPDSVAGWKRQFNLFYEADINKLGYVGDYFEEEIPAINGISKKIYSTKTQKNPVKVMEYIYEESSLKEIRISVKESNAIYEVIKEMKLHFNKEEKLIGFDITGGESMTVKEDLNYAIIGTIIY